MSLPRYERYKDSGVEWLGEVPEGWDSARISALARSGKKCFIDGDWIESPYITDEGIRLLQTGNIGVGFFKEQGFRFISKETFQRLDCTEVEPGDVLICRLADPVGRACIAPKLGERMITSVDVCILKPSPSVFAQFVVYLFSSADYLSFMESQCRGGTRDRVSRSFLGAVRVSIPPLQEQKTIAAFLDRETAKIDELINEQTNLIGLLKEKRQAVISHAVTKGLDPNVPMKDSGVEWLGEVPSSWKSMSIRRLSKSVMTGGTPSEEAPSEFLEDGLPWYTPGDFGQDLLLGTSSRSVSKQLVLLGAVKAFPAQSVLIVSIGATLGKLGFTNQVCSSNQQINAVIPNESIGARFMAYSLSVKTEVMRTLSNASTIGIMNQEKTKLIVIAVPSLEEQQAIVDYLDRETAKLDALTAEAERSIKLLKERRSALISAAVTGKIDVRNYACGGAA